MVEQMHMIRIRENYGKEGIDGDTLRRKDEEESSGDESGFPLLVEIDDEETEEEIETVAIRREAFRAINADQGPTRNGKAPENDENTPLKLRKSSKILERPIRSRKETQTLVIMMEVNS